MTKEDRDRAQARLDKATRAAQDARSGKADRDAATKAVLDNMAKLKALRLAREAAAPPAPVAVKKARAKGVYDQDYATITPFHKLARDNGLPMLLVHHTNKGAAEDPVMRISGTMGLSGAADTTLVLERAAGSLTGELHIRGRDVAERSVALQFDPDTGCVTLLGPAEDFRKSEARLDIIKVLKANIEPMTPVEIAAAIGKNRSSIRWLLGQMHRKDEISRLGNGKYYLVGGGYQ